MMRYESFVSFIKKENSLRHSPTLIYCINQFSMKYKLKF